MTSGLKKKINPNNNSYIKRYDIHMREKSEAIAYCLTYTDAYEDYPFSDTNWCVIRHKTNNKVFAWIFNKDGYVWINVKCNPEWAELQRKTFKSVIPGYHMNKTHWNSVILDGSIPDEEIYKMIDESFYLT